MTLKNDKSQLIPPSEAFCLLSGLYKLVLRLAPDNSRLGHIVQKSPPIDLATIPVKRTIESRCVAFQRLSLGTEIYSIVST